MNQTEILELKSTITEMKKSLEGSAADLNWQKKESANLKINQMRLSSLGTERKKNKK
jgi:hypothetical protein